MDASTDWFEPVWSDGKIIPGVSKFSRNDFVVPVEVVEARWVSWTDGDKSKFASAFSQRLEMDDNDQGILDFLMDNGGPSIWRTIAIAVAKHRDRGRAVTFLSARISESTSPVANFYQAVGLLLALECAPPLRKAMSRHQQAMRERPAINTWSDRFAYLDYLSCSAALFLITKEKEYRRNIEGMLRHSDPTARRLAQTVLTESGIITA